MQFHLLQSIVYNNSSFLNLQAVAVQDLCLTAEHSRVPLFYV